MASFRYDLAARKTFHMALQAGKTVLTLGFAGTEGDVLRFIARYRLAKSFQGVLLSDYGLPTINGYNAIFRLFLAWTAFERFLEITEVTQKDAHLLFDPHEATQLCQTINRYDTRKSFLTFIRDHTYGPTRAEVDSFLNSGLVDSAYLAVAIRHVFAHGVLTPHANKSRSKNVARMCNDIADFLLRTLDNQFTQRITQSLNINP